MPEFKSQFKGLSIKLLDFDSDLAGPTDRFTKNIQHK